MLDPGQLASVLGTGQTSACAPRGDGGPAAAATIDGLFALSVHLATDHIVYFADNGNHAIRAANLSASGVVVAGVSIDAGEVETLAESGFVGPTGLAVDRDGDVYVTDGANQGNCEPADRSCTHIYVVDGGSGETRTVAGTGTPGAGDGDGDGGPALQASFNFAFSVAVRDGGGLLVSDNQDSSPDQPASGRVRLIE
jgi:hypothetical protein